jgi:hypothetical protein
MKTRAADGLRQGTASAVPKRPKHSGVLTPEGARRSAEAYVKCGLFTSHKKQVTNHGFFHV